MFRIGPLRRIAVGGVASAALLAVTALFASAPDPATARPSYEIRDPAFLYKDYCQTRSVPFRPS